MCPSCSYEFYVIFKCNLNVILHSFHSFSLPSNINLPHLLASTLQILFVYWGYRFLARKTHHHKILILIFSIALLFIIPSNYRVKYTCFPMLWQYFICKTIQPLGKMLKPHVTLIYYCGKPMTLPVISKMERTNKHKNKQTKLQFLLITIISFNYLSV